MGAAYGGKLLSFDFENEFFNDFCCPVFHAEHQQLFVIQKFEPLDLTLTFKHDGLWNLHQPFFFSDSAHPLSLKFPFSETSLESVLVVVVLSDQKVFFN